MWNDLGQLASVTTNGTTVSYVYNGFGQRVKRTEGSAVTWSIYDGDDLLLETNGSGNVLREYTMYPGIDAPHSLRVWSGTTPGSPNFYVVEQPGHVVGLVNSSSQVAHQYRYTPWGQSESTTETVPQPLRFMAREYDAATALYYVRARWYDPALARFNSEDPIGLEGGVNLYNYSANDPLNLRDPSGLQHGHGWCLSRAAYDPTKLGRGYWEFESEGKGYHAHESGGFVTICETIVSWGQTFNYVLFGDQSGLTRDAAIRGLRLRETAEELSCMANYYGAPVLDAASGAILARTGEPTIAKPFVMPGSSPATSEATQYFSRVLGKERMPWRVWTPTRRRLTASSTRAAAILGRWTPVLGYGLLAVDATYIMKCAND